MTGGKTRAGATGVAVLAGALAATAATLAFSGGGSDDSRVSAQDERGAGDADRRTIRVNGHATVEVTPDAATVTLGAQHTAERAKQALDTVSMQTQAIIDLLGAAGIDDADIQTSELSVWPQYDGDSGQRITGYQASNTVTAKTTDLDGLGDVLDQVSQAAGDQFRLDGISFSFEDPEAVLADARAEAIANARARAGQFVAGEDVEIGDIRTIVESGAEPEVPYELEMAADEARAASVPIEAGSQELAVDVTVVFQLT